MGTVHTLDAISPLDGRYRRKVEDLGPIFGERGLIASRMFVEGEYLIALSEHEDVSVRAFTPEEKELIRSLYEPTIEQAGIVKLYETKGFEGTPATNHDVKAVEYYMKHALKDTSLNDVLEYIHFSLTSFDINNIAHSDQLRQGLGNIVLPTAEEVREEIGNKADQYKDVPMLARTHGQPASPTTVGKEFRVFEQRLKRQLQQFYDRTLLVKLNGASGNYNAHQVAFPNVDWIQFSIDFVERLNEYRDTPIRFKPNIITTQIEPYDTYAELFDNLGRMNNVLTDFSKDTWQYISDGWFKQKPKAGEVGSSAMPHKVNPIDFENAEGNLGLANAIGDYMSKKLPISRLQRDLSDSTVVRNLGVVLGYSQVAYTSLLKGMGNIEVNEERVITALEKHPEVISEAIQTVLRREGAKMPYERLKDLTRGKKPTMETFSTFIEGLDVKDEVKEELHQITPTNYTGIANILATYR